jgi:hypothetical protein
MGVFTHPDSASLVAPLFAARKEGEEKNILPRKNTVSLSFKMPVAFAGAMCEDVQRSFCLCRVWI